MSAQPPVPADPDDVAWQPEDEDPESLAGADIDDLPKEAFLEQACFTDAEWALLVAVRATQDR